MAKAFQSQRQSINILSETNLISMARMDDFEKSFIGDISYFNSALEFRFKVTENLADGPI